jgi:DNA-binding winged helix-turn-helix (wHTH) protein/TolB-like protein
VIYDRERRISVTPRELYAFGEFRLDATGRILVRNGVAIPLAPKQIDTLIVLVRARGAVVDRDQLMREVWPGTFVEEGGITRNISTLRKALDEAGTGQTFIETLPKRGYRFTAPVAIVPGTSTLTEIAPPVPAPSPAAPPALESRDPSQLAPNQSRLRPAAWIAIPLTVAIIVLFAGYGRSTLGRYIGGFESPVRSVAVLPFRHIGTEPIDRQLGVGLADVLATRFGSLASLAVVPTGTSLKFEGKDPVEAGRALDVDAVLDGSILKSGGRYRVTVQLLRVSSGYVLWAGAFDEPDQNLLAVEDNVAAAVSGLLVPRLQADERARLARRSTSNPEAWRAYLTGRALWATRSQGEVEASIRAFEAAIGHDPGFALAHAGLAQALIAQGGYQYRWPSQVYPRARLSAIRAIELDGGLADAHGALAAIAWTFDRDWATADEQFRRALALNPNDSTLHQWHAAFSAAMGRTDEALAAVERAIHLDPRGFSPNYEKVRTLVYARRYDEAIQQAAKTMTGPGEIVYSAVLSSLCHDLQGRRDESWADLEKAHGIVGDIPVIIAFKARYAARDGRRDEALSLVHRLEQLRNRTYVDPIFIAGAYMGLGDVDNALRWARQAIEDRSLYASYLAVDPVYLELHDDARFQEVLRSAGLSDAVR